MQSSLYHLQLNVNFSNLDFYKEMMGVLGWTVILEVEGDVIGYAGTNEASVWFVNVETTETQNYDARGVNHVGIGVSQQSDVDEFTQFLESKDVPPLFETPRHRPEFAMSESETYYQVMFESPDGILFEVVYTGAK